MRLTGGQALARQLALEGITDVFGIPGVQLDWAVDGLRQVGNQIRYVVPRHEQTTAYMADGYARTTGKIGTCMVVPGPGMLNAMAGLSTAYACNSRVLAIVGNIHSKSIGKGVGLLHEIRNQSEILGCVTKWQAQAWSPKEIPGLVREAVKQLRSGRPQPVGLEIAHDVLQAADDFELVQPDPHEDGRVRPDPAAIDKAAALLAKAKLPVIYVGGGVLAAHASAALQALAEKLQAPVVMSENGRGALSDRHPLALTALAGRGAFAHADVALIVGSRFADTNSGASLWTGDNLRYIWLNLDPKASESPRNAEISIEADAGLGLEALNAALTMPRPSRALDLAKLRAWADEQLQNVADLVGWIRALRAALPDDGIFVNELTQVGYLTRSALSGVRPVHLHHAGLSGHAWLRLSRPRSALRTAIPAARWSASMATAASAGACRNWRRRANTVSSRRSWCSTTAISATSSARCRTSSAARTGPICTIRNSTGWQRRSTSTSRRSTRRPIWRRCSSARSAPRRR